jgi:hypothetical protein
MERESRFGFRQESDEISMSRLESVNTLGHIFFGVVGYQEALMLQRLKYNESVSFYYAKDRDGEVRLFYYSDTKIITCDDKNKFVPAPTFAAVAVWLSKNHGVNIKYIKSGSFGFSSKWELYRKGELLTTIDTNARENDKESDMWHFSQDRVYHLACEAALGIIYGEDKEKKRKEAAKKAAATRKKNRALQKSKEKKAKNPVPVPEQNPYEWVTTSTLDINITD